MAQPEQSFLEYLVEIWPYIAGTLTLLLSLIASSHIVLTKSDNRSAVGWVGLVWLAPVVGATLYVMFGINRIRRRGMERTGQMLVAPTALTRPEEFRLPAERAHLMPLTHLVDRISGRSLTSGNAIVPLRDGDEAYPAMVEAIDSASQSVALATYIFDNRIAGRMLQDALSRALERGVEVRVLIDAVGARYSWPPIVRSLRRRGIRVARFEPTFLPWRMPYMNLRNHRKILVVDGKIGFTGGMNIREGSLLGSNPRHPVQDLHFRVEGPVVAHLMATFADDWGFSAREELEGPAWYPALE
ncbi:MAG: phospholipase D-like domain-containing protein, partial [Gemmatimonadales bacterium]